MNNKDVLSLIFQQLDFQTLGKISLVCKRWNSIASSNFVWKMLYLRSFPGQVVDEKTVDSWKGYFRKSLLSFEPMGSEFISSDLELSMNGTKAAKRATATQGLVVAMTRPFNYSFNKKFASQILLLSTNFKIKYPSVLKQRFFLVPCLQTKRIIKVSLNYSYAGVIGVGYCHYEHFCLQKGQRVGCDNIW